ncbi:MAG: S41 family peptidase [Planctomycetota bacterium]|nr:S41 family peptidase [Planctomycetota bacterium]
MFRPSSRQWISLLTATWFLFAAVALVSAKEPEAKADKSPGQAEKADDDYYQLLEVFVDSLDQIERNYVKDVNRRDLIEAAIEGMVGRLDPHSSYIPPKDVGAFRSSVENKFGGIGIHVAIEDGKLTVISPLVGAPAYQQGVLAGDHIVEIEGESTKGITLDGAVRKLKGDVGTDVTITVQQSADTPQRKITIRRALVRVETVLGARRQDDDSWSFLHDPEQGIGYVRINAFSRDTARDLRKVLAELKSQNVRGLVLDLRLNPGGLLTSAIEICDLFVSEGLIVSTKGRNTKERSWRAKTAGTFEDFPIAVLINRFSASASEIVAACLQDHGRAVVVGERSFGKGSVQNVIDLEDGNSVLKLTTASYRRPNGHNIHRFPDSKKSEEWGVKPDANYKVELSAEELRELVAYRRRQYVARGKSEPAAIPDDRQEADPEEDVFDPQEDDPDSDADTEVDTDVDDPTDPDADDNPESDPESDPESGSEDSAETTASAATKTPFQDRQLERALEYLSGELARAEIDR